MGRYPYTRDLVELQCRKPTSQTINIPLEGTVVRTPLAVHEWREWLRPHPDRSYAEYLLHGLEQGFRIGFKYGDCTCTSAKSNMQSARANPAVVDEYLKKEVGLGRVIGPLKPEEYPTVHVSRFGVIPKRHQSGTWRLIVDLSHPAGASVNDGIEPEICTLKYTSIDEAVGVVLPSGPGTVMAKFDIECAYRIIPVHPDDRSLLGMMWRGGLYLDTALPFGLRSAPKVFNALADGLAWGLSRRGIKVLHYLDDFLLVGKPEECDQALSMSLTHCSRLGVPIAGHKTEGPAAKLVFLGIELDATNGVMRLPTEKLHRLKQEIGSWAQRRSCTKRELLSLIGQLQHACCIVKPGRSFLRRMISLSTVARELHHRIRLNKGFRSDLQWWHRFLPSWNGTGMMSAVARCGFVATVTSDASGSWGCGAFASTGEWFQLKWPDHWQERHITVKELLPVVLSIAIWGYMWRGGAVRCRCDNAAVVAILRSGTSKNEHVMHLIRSLFFLAAGHNLSIVGEHIPGKINRAADALSRNNLGLFFSTTQEAKPAASRLPAEVVEGLVHRQPDWTSVNWTRWLADTLPRVLPNQLNVPTELVRTDTWGSAPERS